MINAIQLHFLKDSSKPDLENVARFHNLELFRQYYTEYYGSDFHDLSFYLDYQGKVIAHVLAYKIDNKLCWPLDGVKIDIDPEINTHEKAILNSILEHIETISTEQSCNEIIIKDSSNSNNISKLGEILFSKRYNPKLQFEMLVDFQDFNEKKYFSNIRKSYKSLINWGKRNLEIEIINQQNPSPSGFQKFKEFHHQISGRQTRSDKTWDIQYQIISQGMGELILAHYKGRLVAGSLFIDQAGVSLYFTGVYERSLFDYGVSHYLLYLGICRSFERKTTKLFSLGIFESDIKDPKWYNIQFFKKGFCERLAPTIFWTKPFQEETDIDESSHAA